MTDNEIVKVCENCKHRFYCKKQKVFEKAVAFDENAKCTRNEAETMTNKKLTDNLSNNSPNLSNGLSDNDIVKALGNAEYRRDGITLRGFYLDHEIIKQVIDLINRQKAEIENLRNSKYIFASVDYCESDLTEALKENDRLKAEIERLKKSNRNWRRKVQRLKAEQKMADGYEDALVEMTKSEAYKEFAERLKDDFCASCSTHKRYHLTIEQCRGKENPHRKWCFKMRLIDNLLKELIGE